MFNNLSDDDYNEFCRHQSNIKLAIELVLNEHPEKYKTEEDMLAKPGDENYNTDYSCYTVEAQKYFDEAYDYFSNM